MHLKPFEGKSAENTEDFFMLVCLSGCGAICYSVKKRIVVDLHTSQSKCCMFSEKFNRNMYK